MLKKWISSLQLARDILRRQLGLFLFDRETKQFELNSDFKRVVLVRWDAKWGDAIVSSFVFREWRKTYPGIKIDVITTPNMSALFKEHFGADHVYEVKKRPSYSDLKELASEIGSVDLLVHLSKSLKMKDLYFMSKLQARIIAGLDDEVGLINLKLGELTSSKHFSEKFKLLLEKTGVLAPDANYIVPHDAEAQGAVDFFIDEVSSPILVFNPYGNGSSRKLNETSIKEIINIITEAIGNISIVLLMTPDKKEEILSICSDYNNVFCYEKTQSIYDSIAIMRHAEWVVSVDTAIVHIATGLKKPTLALYNLSEENYQEWHPNNTAGKTIFSPDSYIEDINLIDLDEFKKNIASFI